MKSKLKNSLNSLSDLGSFVYSTNPDYKPEVFEEQEEKLDVKGAKVYLELKRLKGNKLSTVVTEYPGNSELQEQICKELKTRCGTGGSVTHEGIMLQGDFIKKVTEYFLKQGFNVKRKGG